MQSGSASCRIRLYLLLEYRSCIIRHMRTTVDLEDELVEEARELTGIHEKTALLHAGLHLLVERENARRLAALGGTMPDLKAIPRRRAATT